MGTSNSSVENEIRAEVGTEGRFKLNYGQFGFKWRLHESTMLKKQNKTPILYHSRLDTPFYRCGIYEIDKQNSLCFEHDVITRLFKNDIKIGYYGLDEFYESEGCVTVDNCQGFFVTQSLTKALRIDHETLSIEKNGHICVFVANNAELIDPTQQLEGIIVNTGIDKLGVGEWKFILKDPISQKELLNKVSTSRLFLDMWTPSYLLVSSPTDKKKLVVLYNEALTELELGQIVKNIKSKCGLDIKSESFNSKKQLNELLSHFNHISRLDIEYLLSRVTDVDANLKSIMDSFCDVFLRIGLKDVMSTNEFLGLMEGSYLWGKDLTCDNYLWWVLNKFCGEDLYEISKFEPSFDMDEFYETQFTKALDYLRIIQIWFGIRRKDFTREVCLRLIFEYLLEPYW